MAEKTYSKIYYFHAGQFLKESLERSVCTIEWLAEKTGMEVSELECIFKQSNMDAVLFVNIGNHFGMTFFDTLHEVIFHHHL